MMSAAVIWHDLECGAYEQDLPLWLELARTHASAEGSRILDVGAGTGRVTLALAAAGYRVTALDLERELLTELEARVEDLDVETVAADARDFNLGARRFDLCVVPMQTVQLLDGPGGREAFLATAARHLNRDGVLAIAIAAAEDFEEFEWHDGDTYPLPDIVEHDGSVYCSQPTAVRREGERFVLERRREVIDPHGDRTQTPDRIALDMVSATELEEAGQRAGLKPLGVRLIAPTGEHIGSEVVILGR